MNKHCCQSMEDALTLDCERHDDEYECPDVLVSYHSKFDEYGLIIHDGGSSSITILFCPWCGVELPASKRDLWWDMLEKLGFDDPVNQNIPAEFHSDAWYCNT